MRRRQLLAKPRKEAKRPEPSLEERYEAKFGRPPHHRMKRETIERKLADDNTG